MKFYEEKKDILKKKHKKKLNWNGTYSIVLVEPIWLIERRTMGLRTIKGLRADNEMTQESLASKLDIHVATLRSYEEYKTIPDIKMCYKIANVFKVDIKDIKWYE